MKGNVEGETGRRRKGVIGGGRGKMQGEVEGGKNEGGKEKKIKRKMNFVDGMQRFQTTFVIC